MISYLAGAALLTGFFSQPTKKMTNRNMSFEWDAILVCNHVLKRIPKIFPHRQIACFLAELRYYADEVTAVSGNPARHNAVAPLIA
jgi:hypothetical protein